MCILLYIHAYQMYLFFIFFFHFTKVSAGMDMALGFISDIYGRETADEVALTAEYDWHDNPDWDPFAEKIFGSNIQKMI
jgi:hypothetical protein